MSKEGWNNFLDSLGEKGVRDLWIPLENKLSPSACEKYMQGLVEEAREQKFDVELSDVKKFFLNETPEERPLPPRGGGGSVTSAAIGEESGRKTTKALGEEGRRPPRLPVDPPMSTMAMGEEGGGIDF